MPINGRVHAERGRAESFGSVAEQYERSRPGFPAGLIDDLVARVPPGSRALDVGCGTGKAARLLAERGLDVLGVDVDERMAAVGRRHGLTVEVAPFERWDAGGRRFALVTCAQAWHWIQPDIGAAKAADVLEPDGTLALFWNYGRQQPELRSVLDGIYRRLAPQLAESVVQRPAELPYAGDLRGSGRFRDVEERRYRWRQSYSAAQWLALIGTHSDHLQLPREQRQRLFDAVAAAVEHHGGVDQDVTTYVVLARRAD